jgi:hypothetical protein
MKRKLLTLIAVLAAVLSVTVAVAPSASAYCTGSPGCTSGWKSITVYDSSSGKNFNVNIDITWTADNYNTRTFYFSGSTKYPDGSLPEGMSYMALYYRLHPNGNWISIDVRNPGPAYGTYSYDQFVGWSTPRDFVVAGCSFGRCVNSPIVLN